MCKFVQRSCRPSMDAVSMCLVAETLAFDRVALEARTEDQDQNPGEDSPLVFVVSLCFAKMETLWEVIFSEGAKKYSSICLVNID